MTDSTPNPNERTRREWAAGSYPAVGRQFLALAADLVDAAGIESERRVLDVACGTGNVALTAARRGANVTAVDVTPAMIDGARRRAAAMDADVDWREGDATALPLDDDAFGITVSCLGHVFAADPDAAATELVRVTAPGGRVAFTAWTPESGIAAMMGALSEFLPPRDDAPPPPFLWGDPETVEDRFGDRVADLRFETGEVRYPAVSPAGFWAHMTADSGPVRVALEDVDGGELPAVREAVVAALDPYFSGTDNAVALEYRLVTATVA